MIPSPLAGLRTFQRRESGPSLSALVAAILAGTQGFALDPSDLATLWQDSARTTPVTTAGQPVGCIQSKWGVNTRNITQGTSGLRPIWDGVAGIDFDGTDDFLSSGGFSLHNAAPAAFASVKARADVLNGGAPYSQIITGAATRFNLRLEADGGADTQGRVINAGSGWNIAKPAGVAVAGVARVYTIETAAALSTAVRFWHDGILTTGAVSSSPQNFSSSNTTFYLGKYAAAERWFNGGVGRMVQADFIPTDEQRAIIEAWVDEAAL